MDQCIVILQMMTTQIFPSHGLRPDGWTIHPSQSESGRTGSMCFFHCNFLLLLFFFSSSICFAEGPDQFDGCRDKVRHGNSRLHAD